MMKLLFSASILSVVVMIVNFTFKLYLSYLYAKEELGLFYTFLDVVSVGIVFFSGFKDALIKAFDRANIEAILYWYSRFFSTLFVFISFGVVLFYQKFELGYSSYTLLLLLFFNGVMVYTSYLNSAYKKYKTMLYENLVMALSLVGSFLLFYHLFAFHLALLYAYISAYSARTLYLYLLLDVKTRSLYAPLKSVEPFIKDTLLSGAMYFFSAFFISMSGVMILYFYEDKLFLGEYQVVIRTLFFSLVGIVIYPLSRFTFPHISKIVSSGEYSKLLEVERKLVKYLSIFFVFTLGATFFTPFLVDILFPLEYQESYKMLNVMLPFLAFMAYTAFALNIIKGFDRFDLALYVRLFGTLLFFGANYIFFFLEFDAKAVIYSLDISFFGMFILSLYYRKRLLR